MEKKFKVGDTVEVSDYLYTYLSVYTDWFRKHHITCFLPLYRNCYSVDNGKYGTVVFVGKHTNFETMLYAIKLEDKIILASGDALTLVSNTVGV